jgi:hypothetical protein
MKAFPRLLLMLGLLAGLFGCSGDSDKGINQAKEKPVPAADKPAEKG